MVYFPDPRILDEQIENEDSTYRCFNCEKRFPGKEMLFEDGLPNWFSVTGLDNDQKVPKCPYCNAIAFFGFNEVS
jgi:DNA-directed RNA polymerase subunit RPC12/RpoP